MRTINQKITVQEINLVEKTATNEAFVTIFEDKENRQIAVTVSQDDAEGNSLNKKNYFIKEEKYDLLMSANPDFAPNKLENEYREEDIWYVIDLIRMEQEAY